VIIVVGIGADGWEGLAPHARAVVEQAAVKYDSDSRSTGAYVEYFLRGMTGDLFGAAREDIEETSKYRREFAEAQRQILAAHAKLEEVAARYEVVRTAGEW